MVDRIPGFAFIARLNMASLDIKEWYTEKEVAAIMKVSRRSVRKIVKHDRLHPNDAGLFRAKEVSDLMDWLEIGPECPPPTMQRQPGDDNEPSPYEPPMRPYGYGMW